MKTLIVNIALSFVISGLWVALTTWIAERKGSKKGGAIALLPSTLLVSLLFVALTVNKNYAASAAQHVPIGMAMNAIFLTVFVLILRQGLIIATTISLTVWLCCAIAFKQLHIESAIITTIIFIAVVSISYYILEHIAEIKSVPQKKQKFKISTISLRALFAGSVVVSTIIISRFASHYWTGIFSAFPAVMLSGMIILTRSQGYKFAQATAKTMILASGNIVVYAFIISYLYKITNITTATLTAFATATLYVIMLYPIIVRTK